MKRTDLFQDRKCIHIKLEKDVHASFRQLMFEYGISMQETLNEFARVASARDRKAIAIIERYVDRKIKEQMERIEAGKPKKKIQKVSELDHDTLYDLIEESNNEE